MSTDESLAAVGILDSDEQQQQQQQLPYEYSSTS
jgi:hypothetical protein